MSCYSGPHEVTSGLIGYWDPGNTKSYSGSGLTLYDLSIYNKNMGLSSITPVYTNPYITYNGTSNQWAQSTVPVTLTTAFTVSTWCRILSTPTNFATVFGGGVQGCTIQNNSGTVNQIGGWAGIGGIGYYTTYYTYSLNIWYNFQFTWSSGDYLRFYVNGIQTNISASTVTGTLNAPTTFKIALDTAYINADISACCAYNRALTAAEVLQNFNATRGRFGI